MHNQMYVHAHAETFTEIYRCKHTSKYTYAHAHADASTHAYAHQHAYTIKCVHLYTNINIHINHTMDRTNNTCAACTRHIR